MAQHNDPTEDRDGPASWDHPLLDLPGGAQHLVQEKNSLPEERVSQIKTESVLAAPRCQHHIYSSDSRGHGRPCFLSNKFCHQIRGREGFIKSSLHYWLGVAFNQPRHLDHQNIAQFFPEEINLCGKSYLKAISHWNTAAQPGAIAIYCWVLTNSSQSPFIIREFWHEWEVGEEKIKSSALETSLQEWKRRLPWWLNERKLEPI